MLQATTTIAADTGGDGNAWQHATATPVAGSHKGVFTTFGYARHPFFHWWMASTAACDRHGIAKSSFHVGHGRSDTGPACGSMSRGPIPRRMAANRSWSPAVPQT
jgi:hypothetical protein